MLRTRPLDAILAAVVASMSLLHSMMAQLALQATYISDYESKVAVWSH